MSGFSGVSDPNHHHANQHFYFAPGPNICLTTRRRRRETPHGHTLAPRFSLYQSPKSAQCFLQERFILRPPLAHQVVSLHCTPCLTISKQTSPSQEGSGRGSGAPTLPLRRRAPRGVIPIQGSLGASGPPAPQQQKRRCFSTFPRPYYPTLDYHPPPPRPGVGLGVGNFRDRSRWELLAPGQFSSSFSFGSTLLLL